MTFLRVPPDLSFADSHSGGDAAWIVRMAYRVENILFSLE